MIIKQENGNLQMIVSESERKQIKRINRGLLKLSVSESIFIKLYLKPFGFNEIKPEDCGALTNAPLITDKRKNVWGFMDYQVTSFLEELAAGKEVIWQRLNIC